MHHDNVTSPNPLGDKQGFYEKLINGCVEHYEGKGSRCKMNEKQRVQMSLRQPRGMNNYVSRLHPYGPDLNSRDAQSIVKLCLPPRPPLPPPL